jgi:hypothetical protein
MDDIILTNKSRFKRFSLFLKKHYICVNIFNLKYNPVKSFLRLSYAIVITLFTSCNLNEPSDILESEIKSSIRIDKYDLPVINESLNDFIKKNGDEFDLSSNPFFQSINRKQIDDLTVLFSSKDIIRKSENYTVKASEIFDLSNSRSTQLIIEGETYHNVIHCINQEYADFSKNPIIDISATFDIDDEHLDYIPAYRINESGYKTEFFIGESHADSLDIPIYIFASHSDALIPADNDEYEIDSVSNNLTQNTASRVMYPSFNILEYQINYRYENDRKSEYRISFLHHYAGPQFWQNNDKKGHYIDNIHKRDVGKRLYDAADNPSFTPGFYGLTYYGTYVCTFECDWAQPVRYVGVDGPEGVQYHQIRMKGSDQFYQRIYVPA